MSATTIIDLGRIFEPGVRSRADAHLGTTGDRSADAEDRRNLRIEGHLPECRHHHRPPSGCDWCLEVLAASGIRRLTELVTDARSLVEDHDRRGGDVSVAWVVAAADLVASTTASRDDITGRETAGEPVARSVPSIDGLSGRLRRLAIEELEPLRSRIDLAVAVAGPVERRCLAGSGLLAGAALHRPEHAARLHRLPTGIRTALSETAGLLSPDVCAGGLLPVIERIHWDGLPMLRTQPHWRRRTKRSPASPVDPGATTDPGASSGSLEALVIEAAIAEVVERLSGMSDELVATAPAVSVDRRDRVRRSDRTLSLTLRMGRIDWLSTFIDSDAGRCWGHLDGRIVVPWTVAVAITEGERLGLVSATHAERAETPSSS